jgi:hypothetical protein
VKYLAVPRSPTSLPSYVTIGICSNTTMYISVLAPAPFGGCPSVAPMQLSNVSPKGKRTNTHHADGGLILMYCSVDRELPASKTGGRAQMSRFDQQGSCTKLQEKQSLLNAHLMLLYTFSSCRPAQEFSLTLNNSLVFLRNWALLERLRYEY